MLKHMLLKGILHVFSLISGANDRREEFLKTPGLTITTTVVTQKEQSNTDETTSLSAEDCTRSTLDEYRYGTQHIVVIQRDKKVSAHLPLYGVK